MAAIESHFAPGSKLDRGITTEPEASFSLTLNDISKKVQEAQYAVLGPITARSVEIGQELKNGISKRFDKLIRCNVGDAPALGQKPVTFFRQALAYCACPDMYANAPDDVKELAERFLDSCHGRTLGAYTDASGVKIVRADVAAFIQERDMGERVSPDDIILTTGAKDGINVFLALLNQEIEGKSPGVMIPVPTYPVYSATMTVLGITQIPYFLNESAGWSLNVQELKQKVDEARKHCNPKAIVVVNPGNPTGQVLPLENIKEIIRFAYEEKLVIMADEVYQNNVYGETSQFHSFKRVAFQMNHPYNKVQLVSYNSVSKGYMGECGIRSGYMELANICPEVKCQLKKLFTISGNPPSIGALAIDCLVRPPKLGSPSYERFVKETQTILGSLKERAHLMACGLNAIPGFHCNEIQGAMYAFPRFDLPCKFVEKANKLNQEPDFMYCMMLLEETGVCVLPGSGFGQVPGTYHLRTTILPSMELIKEMLQKLKEFHMDLLKTYDTTCGLTNKY